MAMRAEYEVRKLPDSFVTHANKYGFVEDENGRKNRYGERPQRITIEENGLEVRGGWIILVRGKPGHSIRITSLDQARQHKLKVIGNEIVPRFIDSQTGEEVNEEGIPLTVAAQLGLAKQARDNANKPGQRVETDIDVMTTAADEFDSAELADADKEYASGGEEHVVAAIEKLEDE